MDSKQIALVILLSSLAFCGCQVPQMTANDKPLDGLFELKVTTEKTTADPGEPIRFTAEIINTGESRLWIPPRQAVSPTVALKTHFWVSSRTSDSYITTPTGIVYRALKPGQSYRYRFGVVAPKGRGELRLSCSIDPTVFAAVTLGEPLPPLVIGE